MAPSVIVVRRRRYDASILRGDYFVVRHLKRFLECALRERVWPGSQVGDVGCGEQPLRDLVRELGGNYTGIDIHQNAAGTVDVLADITSIPLPEKSFDLLVCSEVLEHVPDTRAAFRELARLCKTGGVIILTTPFAFPLHEEPQDFVRLTPHQIRACAAMNRLDVAQLTTSGDELQVIATVWCNIWSRSGRLPRSRIRAAWNVLMRLPVNALVSGLSPVMNSLLPQKYFLNTLCVLVKQG